MRDVGRQAQPAKRDGIERGLQSFRTFSRYRRHLGSDHPRRNAVHSHSLASPRIAERARQSDHACLGGGIGGIADHRFERADRADDDDRSTAGPQQRQELHTAMHDAVEVDVDDATKRFDLEFLATIDHGALRQHQDVQLVERWLPVLDGLCIGHIDARKCQSRKIGAGFFRIVCGRSARAPDMNRGALRAEELGNAVADAAGSANDQRGATVKAQRVTANRFCHGVVCGRSAFAEAVDGFGNRRARHRLHLQRNAEFERLACPCTRECGEGALGAIDAISG